MSRVLYGPVEIHNAQIRDWDQTLEYDPSRTDAMFTRFSFRVEGLVHMQGNMAGILGTQGVPSWTLAASGGGITATQVYQTVLSYLNLPRLRLQVLVGDGKPGGVSEWLLNCVPAAQGTLGHPDMDVDNGPKPKLLAITHFAANNCYRISWQVECAKVVCLRSAGSATVPAILNNRWSVHEEMDGDVRMTRTIDGDLRLSAPIRLLGNDYRLVVVPRLEQGFKRMAMRFFPDKTGLNVNYTITDRQVQTAAPWPATSMSATHREMSNDGKNTVSEMRVSLTGYPGADTQALIARGIQVMDARLQFLERIHRKDNTLNVQSAGIMEHIGEENRVEVWLTLLQQGTDKTSGVFDLILHTMGTPLELSRLEIAPPDKDKKPPGKDDPDNPPGTVTRSNDPTYNPTVSLTPWPYGANVWDGKSRDGVVELFLSCYLQQPCSGPHGMPSGGGPSEAIKDVVIHKSPPYEPDKGNEVSPGEKGNVDSVSESAQKAIYTHSRMESKYITDESVVQLPIASKPAASSGGESGSQADAGADTSAGSAASDTSDDTCVFIKLAKGIAKRIILYDTEAIGKWPDAMPFPETFTDGKLKGRLLKQRRGMLPPALSPDQQQKVFRIHGWAVYGLNRPPESSDKLSVGVQPFTSFKQADTQFDPTKAEVPRLGPGDDTNWE